ncbi:hypothetical protein [Streptomyces sp. 8N616]|uniref:hypothetical protein n=1 Tax=Streptomyces sp. 8N616 TaxID=3457414 RepID=UPI003FD0C334
MISQCSTLGALLTTAVETRRRTKATAFRNWIYEIEGKLRNQEDLVGIRQVQDALRPAAVGAQGPGFRPRVIVLLVPLGEVPGLLIHTNVTDFHPTPHTTTARVIRIVDATSKIRLNTGRRCAEAPGG